MSNTLTLYILGQLRDFAPKLFKSNPEKWPTE